MTNKILIEPMMDWTGRHCRYFMRLPGPGDLVLARGMLYLSDYRKQHEIHLSPTPAGDTLSLKQ